MVNVTFWEIWFECDGTDFPQLSKTGCVNYPLIICSFSFLTCWLTAGLWKSHISIVDSGENMMFSTCLLWCSPYSPLAVCFLFLWGRYCKPLASVYYLPVLCVCYLSASNSSLNWSGFILSPFLVESFEVTLTEEGDLGLFLLPCAYLLLLIH